MTNLNATLVLPVPPAGLSPALNLCLNVEPAFLINAAATEDSWFEALSSIDHEVPVSEINSDQGLWGIKKQSSTSLKDKGDVRLVAEKDAQAVLSGIGSTLWGKYYGLRRISGLGLAINRFGLRGEMHDGLAATDLRAVQPLLHFLEKRGHEIFWARGEDAVFSVLGVGLESVAFSLWEARAKQSGALNSLAASQATEVGGRSFLRVALAFDCLEVAEKLLAVGASANEMDSEGGYPWADCKSVKGWLLLEKYGVKLSQTDRKGRQLINVFRELKVEDRRAVANLINAVAKESGAGIDGLTIWRSAKESLADVTKLLKNQKITTQQAEEAIFLTSSWGRYEVEKQRSLKIPDPEGSRAGHRGSFFNQHVYKYIDTVKAAASTPLTSLNFQTKLGPFGYVAMAGLVADAMVLERGLYISRILKKLDLLDLEAFSCAFDAGDKKSVWEDFPEWLVKQFNDQGAPLWGFLDKIITNKSVKAIKEQDEIENQIRYLQEWSDWPGFTGINKNIFSELFRELNGPRNESKETTTVLLVKKKLANAYWAYLLRSGLHMLLLSKPSEVVNWSVWEKAIDVISPAPMNSYALGLLKGRDAKDDSVGYPDGRPVIDICWRQSADKNINNPVWWRLALSDCLERLLWTVPSTKFMETKHEKYVNTFKMTVCLMGLRDLLALPSVDQDARKQVDEVKLLALESQKVKVLMTKARTTVHMVADSVKNISQSCASAEGKAWYGINQELADRMLLDVWHLVENEVMQLEFRRAAKDLKKNNAAPVKVLRSGLRL